MILTIIRPMLIAMNIRQNSQAVLLRRKAAKSFLAFRHHIFIIGEHRWDFNEFFSQPLTLDSVYFDEL